MRRRALLAFAEHKKEQPGFVYLFLMDDIVIAVAEDADLVGPMMGTPIERPVGRHIWTGFDRERLPEALQKLHRQKRSTVIAPVSGKGRNAVPSRQRTLFDSF